MLPARTPPRAAACATSRREGAEEERTVPGLANLLFSRPYSSQVALRDVFQGESERTVHALQDSRKVGIRRRTWSDALGPLGPPSLHCRLLSFYPFILRAALQARKREAALHEQSALANQGMQEKALQQLRRETRTTTTLSKTTWHDPYSYVGERWREERERERPGTCVRSPRLPQGPPRARSDPLSPSALAPSSRPYPRRSPAWPSFQMRCSRATRGGSSRLRPDLHPQPAPTTTATATATRRRRRASSPTTARSRWAASWPSPWSPSSTRARGEAASRGATGTTRSSPRSTASGHP